ncbi:hypothetical protein [Pseudomonas muyukensis]|uniref:YD repeat-containing protein n=1 Tax=Pseudomonas muyukensis TaxID=2842357 RepID=A0ABX8MCH2_9PSED|nr:hypothetical protein [Pseudomonas muyukensis]QXH36755.1 hypothetical protein KSS95_08015 [Pseudomonas muyukensis]
MSSLHTQASNFLDFMKTGVDHRTGQFTLALTLPLPPANQLNGPALSLTLAFSVLGSSTNRGYGLGWSLCLSELDRHRLRLASGEQYAIDQEASTFAPGCPLHFIDQKLKTLRVTLQDDGDYRVDKKSGEREFLREQEASGRYLVEEMHSPQGHRLFIDWAPYGNAGDFILQRIRDEQRDLLSLEHFADEVALSVNPHTSEAALLRLVLSNERLVEIHLPNVDTPIRIDYDAEPLADGSRLLLPREVHSPLGAHDTITWATGRQGHHLPVDAPFAYLPRVLSWNHDTGTPGNQRLHAYQWLGTTNYLGFASQQAFSWQTGRDNLYQVEHEYRYQCIETLTDGNGQDLGSIERVWDRFHLLVSETTRLGNHETRKDTHYGVDPKLTWEQQPPCCQLPHKVRTTWVDHGDDGASRTETTLYRYDDFGNITYTRYPGGIEEFNLYYPAEGAEGCPPDPLGMVRSLKKNTTQPAQAPGNAPILSTAYTYELLPSLIQGAPAHLVVASERLLDEQRGQVLEHTRQSYIRTPGIAYGREALRITELNGKATTTHYQYAATDDERLSTTTISGFENDAENQASETVAQSWLSGQTTWVRDRAGVCTRYQYDALGRITRTVHAADSPYQTEQTTRYHLDDSLAREVRANPQDNPVMVEQTDASGCRHRQWLDGDGRVVRQEREALDHAPGTFREILLAIYDALGRPISRTRQDWYGTDASSVLTLTSTTAYDDWGQPVLSISPDGISSHQHNDPISLRSEQWQSVGGVSGPKRVVVRDTSGAPIEQQHWTAAGERVRTHKQVRDGLGRVIEEHIEAAGSPTLITTYGHDHYGRITRSSKPDGTGLAWAFAAHSDAEHVESITVTPAQEQQP